MQGALSFWSNRSFFLIGELLLGNLSETVVVVGNAPHDRCFLCTKAPMLRVPHRTFWMALPRPPRGEALRARADTRSIRLAGHGADGFSLEERLCRLVDCHDPSQPR